MRLLLVHDKDPEVRGGQGLGGGLGVYVGEITRRLRELGHHVAVVGFGPSPSPGGRTPAGVHSLRSFRMRYRADVAAQLERIVEDERPDVVHLHAFSAIHPRLLRRLARLRPLLWSLHDVAVACFRRTLLHADGHICERALGWSCCTSGCYRLGSLESRAADLLRVATHRRGLDAYRAVERLLVPSAYLRDVLVRNGFAARSVHVLPLFSRFEGDEHPEVEQEPDRVLFVGRAVREKGVGPLLDALQDLDVPWTATLAGGGPSLAPLRERVEREGLEDRVEFAGDLTGHELPREYRRARVVVVPSIAPESFGLVGPEAMSFERPVVATTAGGITEWLRDGVNGIAVPPSDVPALSRAIRGLLVDPDRGRELGRGGRRMQRERFTLDGHVDALLAHYEARRGRKAS